MEFSSAETAESTGRCCHRLLNTEPPTALQSRPAFARKVKEKNLTIKSLFSLPAILLTPRWAVLASNTQTFWVFPQGPASSGTKGKELVVFLKTKIRQHNCDHRNIISRSRERCSGQPPTLAHCFSKNPKPATWIGFLAVCPTICLLL